MTRDMQVQDSVVIAAEAVELYRQIADPSQMGRWSPENTGAAVPNPGQQATIGTVFVGSNKRGKARWVTRCKVTEATPGEKFGFTVVAIGPKKPLLKGAIAAWAYTFERVDGGTRVTESWTDLRRRWPDFVAARFDKTVTGGHLFADFQLRNIAKTLAALKADFEGTVPA